MDVCWDERTRLWKSESGSGSESASQREISDCPKLSEENRKPKPPIIAYKLPQPPNPNPQLEFRFTPAFVPLGLEVAAAIKPSGERFHTGSFHAFLLHFLFGVALFLLLLVVVGTFTSVK